MKYLLVLLTTFPLWCLAQIREERPLPEFTENPSSVLVDSVYGWSLSLDGQWVSAEKTIYPRLISRDKDSYEDRVNSLGIDNFEELRIYPVKYGMDTLILLVKLYTTGKYKYEVTKKGWKTQTDGYYYLVKKKDLKNGLAKSDTSVIMRKIPLMDGGKLTDINRKKVLEPIKATIRARERYDRILVIMTEQIEKTQNTRFQIYSLHKVFPDVEGVLNDFTLRGKTVYGTKFLFNYNYYETKTSIFNGFFSFPKSFELQNK